MLVVICVENTLINFLKILDVFQCWYEIQLDEKFQDFRVQEIDRTDK